MGKHRISNKDVFELIREADEGLTAPEIARVFETNAHHIHPHLHRLLRRRWIRDSGARRSAVPGKVKGYVYVARSE